MRKILDRAFLFLLLLNISTSVVAQTPANCLEIESILVDACGNPEGENEMVRFKTGSSPINISNLSVSWPNNAFLGIASVSATTNNIVNALNASVTSCGYLLQPTGGVIPAGKMVLLITSTNVITSANSFANLSDTMYVIFQNAGNTAGHFANYSTPSGLRTLSISTLSPSCSDVVSYDKAMLVNQSGGQGGSSALNDGATVEFSWAGTASYVNHACQAPIQANTVSAGPNTSACAGVTVPLNGTAAGNYTSVIWQGGQGTFSNPTSLSTNYTISGSESGAVALSLGVIGNCNDTIFSTVVIVINSAPSVSISASGPTTICNGGTVTLTASGSGNYSWSTGASTSSITVSSAGTYSVSSGNSCGTQTATQTVTVTSAPSVVIHSASTSFCQGGNLLLYATGTGNYSWSGGSNNDSIFITNGGTYSITSTISCGTASDNITITQLPLPVASISSSAGNFICSGSSTTLTANGGLTYLWSPSGSTSSSITVSTAGTYSVTASNSCGNNTTIFTLNSSSIPVANITPSGSTTICAGENLVLNASGGNSYIWSNGQAGNSINATIEGNYWVAAFNSCGNDTAFMFVDVDSVTAFYSASTTSGHYPLTVNFTNLSSTSATGFQWEYGDGNTSNTTEGSNVYELPGIYTATLTATNTLGCIDRYEIVIVVTGDASNLAMPNIFSPNRDGINDNFSAIGSGIEKFDCKIYNRWGILVAELNTFESKWDGRTTSGSVASDGTYFYIATASGSDDKKYELKGFVELIGK
ncbi:MAG: hypothetical protein K0Q95_1955 [Bacteroidota bacterium]|jgi:gliding motility-associated-like protein|nr:hypothetical protein [Bacteroidota bacterium]